MVVRNIDSFSLGNIADLDPDESNFDSENAGLLVGQSFGSSSNPISANIETLGLNNPFNDGVFYDNEVRSGDTLIYQGVSVQLDNSNLYQIKITYISGETATTNVVIVQDLSLIHI